MPNFTSIADPLTELTKREMSVMVMWNPETEEAFQMLESSLCQQPVLVTPNFGREFLGQTDASNAGFGTVPPQVVNGEEHQVVYLLIKNGS